MTGAKALAAAGSLIMGIALAYGFAAGDIAAERGTVLSMPWGIVSLIDVYVGLLLFSGWVVIREKSLHRAVGWIALVLTFGFFAASVCVLIALHRSEGAWYRF